MSDFKSRECSIGIWEDKHLKKKLNHADKFDVTITVSKEGLKALEYIMLKEGDKSVEEVLEGMVKTLSILVKDG